MCWAWATGCGPTDKLECFGCANFLKAGAGVRGHAITTVSPCYAEEIHHRLLRRAAGRAAPARKHDALLRRAERH